MFDLDAEITPKVVVSVVARLPTLTRDRATHELIPPRMCSIVTNWIQDVARSFRQLRLVMEG